MSIGAQALMISGRHIAALGFLIELGMLTTARDSSLGN